MAEGKAAKKRDEPARPTMTLGPGWAALILALLVVLFFHEVSVGGKTFVSPDASAPVGFVRIGEHSLWQDHVYPLWNPFVFLGMPSFGSGAYNPLIYPPDWPLALVQKVVPLPAMTWMLLYYFLGGFFLFLLAREWGARAEAAVLGAAAFVFTPNLVAVGAYGHGSQLVDSAYLPLLLWLAARWLRRGQLTELGWLALAGGCQFLRGHLQICVYTWMAVGLYAGVELLAALRTPARLPAVLLRGVALGAAAALAFGVAGFYNLPLKDYSNYSIRGTGDAAGGVGMAYATGWSMAPYELGSVVLPNAVGFGGGTYWGAMPFTEYPNPFIGIVAAIFALIALARARGPARIFAVVLAVFSVLVSFGRHFPLYGFLYDHFPQFNKFRVPVMMILLFQAAAAVGVAWGWSDVLERGAHQRPDPLLDRLLIALAAVLALCGLAGLVGQDGLHRAYVASAMAHKPGFSAEAAEAAFAGFSGDLGHMALLGLLAVALAWVAARGRLTATAASLVALGLLLAELWPLSGRVMLPTIGEPVAASLDAGRDDIVEFLEKQGPWGSFRVYSPADFQSNRMAGFGIATLGGAHAAKPRLFQDLMDHGSIEDPRFWRLLNVRYIVLPRPLPPDRLPPGYTLAFSGSGAIYENAMALPRATVVGAYGVVVDTGRVALDSIATSRHDPGSFTWLGKDPRLTLGPVTGATANITRYTLHQVDVAVTTPGPALLRLADLWYPDWTVQVDGHAAELLRADHALRAVAVPAGNHRVTFRFASPSVGRGMLLSVVCAAIALALLLAGAWSSRRAPKGEPAPGA